MLHKAHPYASERPTVVPLVPKAARHILDVGCSTGGFGRLLKLDDELRTVWGIDPSVDATDVARQHLDRVITGLFPEDLPNDAPQFELIVFNDVLEHLDDPWATLEQCTAKLAPGGQVLASIPNMRYWWLLYRLALRGDFTYTDVGLFDRTHVRWFTRKTMIELFEGAGFVVEDVTPINISGKWWLQLLRRVRPNLGAELSALQFVVLGRRGT